MNQHRRIIELVRNQKFYKVVAKVLNEYQAAGKVLEDFEEDHDCLIIFDEMHLEGTTGIDAIWFVNESSKTAFILRYDL